MTQRGIDRAATFDDADDRRTYLHLIRENLSDAAVRVLGYCLMTNHVHLIAVPEREDSLAILLRRVHGRYAQYFNVRRGRRGHLWQNRFFACCLDQNHLWSALAYVERNPVRAAMVLGAKDYPWSSAAAHLGARDTSGILDLCWWQRERPPDWEVAISVDDAERQALLRRCTYSGRPFGEDAFVSELSVRFERHWVRGRPPGKPCVERLSPEAQLELFDVKNSADQAERI